MTKKEIAFCEECNDDVEFEIEEVCFDAEIRGTKFKAQRLRAKCKKCGEIVYPVSLEKKNQILLYDAYKKSVGLLTSVEIQEIRKKRGLTQTQLSKLIGCGEKNIARYENGAIQDKIFDKMLRIVDDESAYMHAFQTYNQSLDNVARAKLNNEETIITVKYNFDSSKYDYETPSVSLSKISKRRTNPCLVS